MYCSKCGAEIMDEAVICTKCGCLVEGKRVFIKTKEQKEKDDYKLKNTADIFMILALVLRCWLIIPLLWLIPMRVYFNKQMDNQQPISVEFKVCTLLFVSVIAGILLLCCED